MSVFQLTEWLPVKVAALNLPARRKGEEIVHTTDIVVESEGPNHLLQHFDPELLDMLYREADGDRDEEQLSLAEVEQVSSKPMLRTTALRSPIPLALEFVGYRMLFDRGLGGKQSDILIEEVTVKSIRLWPKEGGTVKLSLHLQSKHVSDVQVGQLRALLKLETKLKLLAPEIKQEPIDAESKAFYQGHLASGDPLPEGAPAPAAPAKKLTKAQLQAKAREEATAAFAATANAEGAAA